MAAAKRTLPPVQSKANKVRLIKGGDAYFTLLLQLIEDARESIHLQTYILSDDETGRQVTRALRYAAKRKVAVYLLADGYASQDLSGSFIDAMQNDGIKFRFFEPFFKSRNFYFGRRIHHKIFVADAYFALTGGINISDNYNYRPGNNAWLDFALYTEGEIAKELCVLCWKTWNDFSPGMGVAPCRQSPLPVVQATESISIGMRRNDWVRHKNEISGPYIDLLRHARSHVTIVCSYFIPGKIIRRLLRESSKRGIKIKVVVAGMSDVWVAKNAERWMYDWLLRNRIELYEYQPSVLHAKIAICDSAWLTIGSYNINNISTYASIELNLNVHDVSLAAATAAQIEEIIQEDCLPVTKESHLREKNIFKQFIRWSSYQFIRMLFYLFTFYFKQKE